MKKIYFVLLLTGFTVLTFGQNSGISLNLGGGFILDEKFPGINAGLDLKIPKVPILVSPYAETYFSNGNYRNYYGGSIILTRKLATPFHLGAGAGITSWNFEGNSRSAGTYHVVIGSKIKISNNIGFFARVKFYLNSKTADDTYNFNNGLLTNETFLFDNDLVLRLGLYYNLPL